MKKSKHFNLIVILLLILIGINCKDNSVNPVPGSSFYPIKIDNNWEYDYKQYDSLGTLEHETLVKEILVSRRIKDGLYVYQFNSPLNPPSPACCNYRFYLQNRSDGVHYLISSDSTGYWVDDILIYKYPCSYNDYFTNGRNDYDTTFVISLNDIVICEAGTFSCIVYKNVAKDIESFTKVTGYSYTYVANGIGKIKVELYTINCEEEFYKKMEYTLKNYNLN